MSPSQFMCSLAGSVQTAHCATTLTTALMGTSELSWNKPTLRAHTVFCKTEKQSSFKSLSSLPLKTIRRDLKKIVILVYVRKPLFQVERRAKPGKCSKPRTREIFRLVTASTLSIHWFETITFPCLFCTMISKETLVGFWKGLIHFLKTSCWANISSLLS